MSATGQYITQEDCERRITAARLYEIFGDEEDGSLSAAEEAAIEDCILDAESEVEQVIRKTYGNAGLDWLREQGTDAPQAVKRMCKDLFEVRAMRRHPEYIRGNWPERAKMVHADLERLRLRELELDTEGSPEPAVNEGGGAYSGDEDDSEPDAKFFDDMGAF